MEEQENAMVNPEYKDRLFKFIFGKETEQSKRWRLQLYNALNGTNFTDPDELEINTIENVVYISMHNDISFLVDTEMNPGIISGQQPLLIFILITMQYLTKAVFRCIIM